jgi:two-component system, LuxR family, sensor kinase FixL
MRQFIRRPQSFDTIALRITCAYAAAGALWILFSDILLPLVISDASTLTHLQTFKGWAFIGVTAFLLFILIRRQVSVMRRADQAQRDSEMSCLMLVEKIRDYEIFMLDPEGRILIWNLGAERSKGYSAEEIVGKHHSIFFTQQDIAAGLPEKELHLAANDGSFEDEGWRIRKDGSHFWANVITSALHDDEGNLRGFAKVVRDITDRKMAEEALRESEAQYRIITDTVSDMIITIDEHSTIRFVNLASEKIFGYRPSELIGQSVTMLMPDHLRNAHTTALLSYLETGIKRISWKAIELPGLHRSGNEVPLEISYGEFMKDDRHFFTGIVRDITERREAERNKEYRDMLERFNQELETLVAERTMNLLAMTLADRVRNPASVIGATANRILRKEEFSDKTKEHISLIRDEAEKLDKTVKDFQDLLTNRQTLFHYEDICSIVRDVLPVIEQEALRKHITVTVELPERQMKINTERNLLKMAIFTLLKNAVELTPDEGKVTVSVSGDDNSIRVVVADNGYGMPQEEIDAVCDPTTQLKSCRFNLGLPLIKQIMAEHMGEISVISEIGKGATVTLTFPVRWSGIPHISSVPAV